jgi:hypothetical protein
MGIVNEELRGEEDSGLPGKSLKLTTSAELLVFSAASNIYQTTCKGATKKEKSQQLSMRSQIYHFTSVNPVICIL